MTSDPFGEVHGWGGARLAAPAVRRVPLKPRGREP
ncbi:hypothetical protein GA0115246_1031711 [Streptomyces sp. SolWspMP-sol7th]|nr:hypothetical protein GA0115246_1031711 [Streptomyces sp. SolWspMP-sol7th]